MTYFNGTQFLVSHKNLELSKNFILSFDSMINQDSEGFLFASYAYWTKQHSVTAFITKTFKDQSVKHNLNLIQLDDRFNRNEIFNVTVPIIDEVSKITLIRVDNKWTIKINDKTYFYDIETPVLANDALCFGGDIQSQRFLKNTCLDNLKFNVSPISIKAYQPIRTCRVPKPLIKPVPPNPPSLTTSKMSWWLILPIPILIILVLIFVK